MLTKPDLLRCPSCRIGTLVATEGGLSCSNCGRAALRNEGTLDLRLDPDQDSALDVESYDSDHDVSADRSEGLFNV